MVNRKLARIAALSTAVLITATACGGDEGGDGGGGGGDDGAKEVNVYGSDGNMGNAFGQDFTEAGLLSGMRGTTPLTDLGEDFRNRMLEVDPALIDFNYAGESYDAVTLVALAAEQARTNDASSFAPFINSLTSGGEKCTDFAGCLAILQAGGDVDYDGITGPLAFADAGEPAAASFGVLQFGDDLVEVEGADGSVTEQLGVDSEQTEFVLAGDEANASTVPAPAAPDINSEPTGGPLTIGTLLPVTGNLAFLGPPEVAGVNLAISDVNAAGGVLGAEVSVIQGDSGDNSTDIATQTSDRLLQAGANAIIGAASSGVSLTVIDAITQAGVVMFSPANTSDQFTTYADGGDPTLGGLYFRTAPPDVLQARALADLIGGDGNNTVAIAAINDAYGTGLSENLRNNLISDGLAEEDVTAFTYDPTAANFDSEVQQLVELNADAIVVIGFEESARIVEGMNEQGIGPQR